MACCNMACSRATWKQEEMTLDEHCLYQGRRKQFLSDQATHLQNYAYREFRVISQWSLMQVTM